MHQTIQTSPAPGSLDVWEFFDVDSDSGGPVPCSNLTSFLNYLCSPSTYAVRVAKTNWVKGARWATLEVYGPKCQNSGRLYISFKLYKAHIEDLASQGGDVEVMRLALKKHIKENKPDFREKGRAQARPIFNLYGLPY